MSDELKLATILNPIIVKIQDYLETDMKIPLLEDSVEISDVENITLKKNTVMIGTGGDVQLIVTFGYDDILLDVLVDAFLYGEKVDESELLEVQESVCCEIANTIIGNAITNPYSNTLISITPPILIREAKSFAKHKNSTIKVATIKTKFGDIQLSAVGPKEMFANKLNFKEL